ncbi:undecaprenol kinase [Gammaproteobacteria bacterium]|nr:diacylglycerol kinase [Rhodocyclaceae bacterium]QOJ31074.1 MAG: diacylglycerol kinase [Gammaproteobacteria bacterium]CAG0938573.1 undecaprenol kinase [Gammaproteobacteria bacterium]
MADGKRSGWRHLLAASGYSLAGLRAAWAHETAFRQEVGLALILAPLAFWLGETAMQRLMLLGSCLLVLIVELLNSAIEAVVDRIGPEAHELSGRAKDLASAAVFLALLLAAAAWAAVAMQRFLS